MEQLSYTEASRELDAIVDFFEQREVDVDVLVGRLERATALIDELDRRLRRTRAQVEELVPRLDALAGRDRGRGGGGDDDDDAVIPGASRAIACTSASCSRAGTSPGATRWPGRWSTSSISSATARRARP